MADRTVKVTLTASVSGYLSELEKAKNKTKETSEDATAQLKKQGEAFGAVGAAATKLGVVAAAGLVLAIAKFAEFDEAMSNVAAATQETTENMSLLREAALEAGATTVFSATEAANAIEELGKAGLTTQEILSGGLSGSLALASAGQLEVARAAEVAAITMKQFKLEGADVPHIADLLAAGAGKAAGDVEDLSQALNQSALVAHATGLSVEETTGALSAFASAGLLGSDAGTSFKTALSALVPKSDEAGKLMQSLGFSAYDAAGNFVGIAKTAGNLQEALKDLTVEQRNSYLNTIFGSDAIRVANILYAEGEEGIQKYIDATNDQGYAAQVAADRLNNLKGDLEELGGAFETALIRSGSGANDILRQITNNLTFLVTAIGDAPEPLLNVGFAFGAVATAMLLAGGVALQAVPKFATLKATLDATGVSLGTFALKTAVVGGALGVATIAVGLFVSAQAQAAATTAELQDTLDQSTGALTDYSREVIAKKLAESGAFEAAKEAGISQRELTDAVIEGGDALEVAKGKLAELNKNPLTAFTDIGFKASAAQTQIRDLNGGLTQAGINFKDQAAAADEAAGPTQTAAAAYLEASDAVSTLNEDLIGLIATVNKANGVGQDAVSQNAAYQASLVSAKEELKKFAAENGVSSKNLDESTAAGAANAATLADLAKSSQDAALAQFTLDGNTEAYQKRLASGRQKIIDQGLAIGGTRSQVEKLADKIYALPTDAEVKIIVDSARAQQKLIEIRNLMASFSNELNITVSTFGKPAGKKAAGGAIFGPGSGTDDRAGLYALSNGEHVLTAQDVKALGGQSGVYAFRESLYSPAAAPVYAGGGSGGGGGSTVQITVPVTVKTLAADNPDMFARAISDGVKTGMRNGTIPTDWNTPR